MSRGRVTLRRTDFAVAILEPFYTILVHCEARTLGQRAEAFSSPEMPRSTLSEVEGLSGGFR
jgi:hypothetical protein